MVLFSFVHVSYGLLAMLLGVRIAIVLFPLRTDELSFCIDDACSNMMELVDALYNNIVYEMYVRSDCVG